MRSNMRWLAVAAITSGLLMGACSSPGGGSDSSGDGASSEANAAAKELGIDLSSCPTDVTKKFGSTVMVGETAPLTGPVAAVLAPAAGGVKAAFDEANESGEYASTFDLIQKDDQFAPDKAVVATQEMVTKDKIDIMTAIYGTPQVIAIRQVLADACIPLVPANSNGKTANSPEAYPWTTVMIALSSQADAKAWAAAIAEDRPEGAKVGMFYSNDASGKDYLAAVKSELKGTKSTLVSEQSIESTDTAAPKSQVTTLRASGADVLLVAPSAAQCGSVLSTVASVGWEPEVYASATCPTAAFDAVGAAADGVHYSRYFKDPTRAPDNADPAVLEWEKTMKKYEPGAAITQVSLGGYLQAQAFFATVKKAESSDLGFSRLGLIVAATHLEFESGLLPDGVKVKLDGLKDQVAIESVQMVQYDAKTKGLINPRIFDFQGELTGIASTAK